MGGDPGVIAPHVIEQDIATDDLVPGPVQILQNRRFLVGQPDFLVAAGFQQQFRAWLKTVRPDGENGVVAALFTAGWILRVQ